MPVTVAKVDLSDAAQRADVAKIYDDSPEWMRRGYEPKAFIEQWIKPCDVIWGGWFNGRIIGAVGIKHTEEGQQLIGICVRRATRRRGVAQQMMEQVLAQMSGRVYIDTRQQPSTDMLFDHLGFTKGEVKQQDGGISWVRWEKSID
ncbi:MAG: acetyl-CoA sensor PanZ family protein [Natronospirillum sp.]